MQLSRYAREARAGIRPVARRELEDSGVTPGELQGRRWRRTSYGFYTPTISGRLTTGQRILDASPLLTRGFALGGWAAAYVLGVDWLDGRDPNTWREFDIDVVASKTKRRSTDSVRYRHAELPRSEVLRVCFQLDAGLPRPLVNVPIFDRGGHKLGIADLLDPEAGFVAEFDGEQHREAEHHRRDNIREERFESANLTVVRADRVDVDQDRPNLVRRLQDGYRRDRSRDRARDTWTLMEPGAA